MASSSTPLTSLEAELAESIRARGRIVSGTEQYPYPSHVNAASFVSIKLSSKANYGVWQEQMMCLVESHGMLGFINGTLKEHGIFEKEGESTLEARYGEWKRSDTLVKGWIFGSLSENAMRTVVGLHTANDVWEKLRTTYGTPPAPATTTASSSTITTDITTTEKVLNRRVFQPQHIPLHKAIKRSDWKNSQEIINRDKDALTAKLNHFGERTLHAAIQNAESIHLFENLLKEINPESLPTMVTINRSNPLHIAASLGNTTAAKMLVEKNPHLLFILNDLFFLPIHMTVINSHERTFLYLLDVCKKHIVLSQQDGYHSPFEGKNGARLLTSAIDSGFFDASIELINEYPDMARTIGFKDNYASLVALIAISRKWDSYPSETRYNFYQRSVYAYVPVGENRLHDTNEMQDIENQGTYKAKFLIKSMKSGFYYVFERIYVKFWKKALLQVTHIKRLQEEKINHQKALLLLKSICEEVAKINIMSDIRAHYLEAICYAVDNDTPEVVEQIIECFPMAIWVDMGGYNITQVAIGNRCEKIYNYLVCHLSYDKYSHIQRHDKDCNNLLHLAGQLAPIHKLNRVSGAALQMQRELQWFEEVRNFVRLKYKHEKNKAQETPIMVFRREHKQLRNEGEEWMKKTVDSYTIVAALIITIVFAAAITVPGGNNDDTGKAIYETRTSFIVFAFADAISLFSSTTSLLLFLSILTTRFPEEDFLYRLPKRLILGLSMLFLSVTSMMVAFSATLYLMFGHGRGWIVIPIATLTCLPIASFVTLQLPLLVDLISSTYGRGIFAKRSDHKLKQF